MTGTVNEYGSGDYCRQQRRCGRDAILWGKKDMQDNEVDGG